MGRRAAGAGSLPEVRLSSVPVREGPAAAMPGVREKPVRMPEGAVPGLRAAPLRVQKEATRKSETRRWQSARDSAHDVHHVLARGRIADVRTAVYGTAIRESAGVFQG